MAEERRRIRENEYEIEGKSRIGMVKQGIAGAMIICLAYRRSDKGQERRKKVIGKDGDRWVGRHDSIK